MTTHKSDDLNSAASDINLSISPTQKWLRRMGWTFFTLFCLIFFTLIKLPEDRVKAYIDGNISAFLADQGISFTATEGHLSFLFGISYTMKDITVTFPPPTAPVHVDRISLYPAILPLVVLHYGGKVFIQNGKGEFEASYSMHKTQFSFSYQAKQFELQKLGVLPFFTGVQASALLDGNGSFSGDTSNYSGLEGNAALAIHKFTAEPQTIAGFSLPQLFISDSALDIKAEKGKLTIKNLHIGKSTPTAGVSDDIQGTVSGDVTLAKQLETSQLNLKLHFSFSDNLKKSFVLLDALLGAGKQPDGSYNFNLTGPLMAPMPTPG